MSSKSKNIIYWIATIWLALGMLSSGIVQLIQMEMEMESMSYLGYPPYFSIILGIWKILGVIAILIPKLPRLKEWAYAGFFFVGSGAMASLLISGSPITEVLPAGLLFILNLVSRYFRPESRKL